MNARQHALAACRPRPGANSRLSDDTFAQEQDLERRPAVSAGPLPASQEMIVHHHILALLTILLFACSAPQEAEIVALHTPASTNEPSADIVREKDFSNSAKAFAQEVLGENFREHSFDLSDSKNPLFLNVFCSDGLETLSAYSNKNYPRRSEPNDYEHFTLFVASYSTSAEARTCFELIKADSQHEFSATAESRPEITERVWLLTYGAKPGGMITQNGLQVFGLVKTCRGTPIGGKWLDYENKFIRHITESGEELEVLNAECGMERYRAEQRIASR